MIGRSFIHRCAALLALLAGSSVASADPPPVSVDVQECDAGTHAQLGRLVAIELSAELRAVPPARESSPDLTRVTVRCNGETVHLDVHDPVSGKELARTLKIAPDDPARARVLALSAAELISTSWLEVEQRPNPVATPKEKTASEETTQAARRSARATQPPARSSLLVGPTWTSLPGEVSLWSGGFRFAWMAGNDGLVAEAQGGGGRKSLGNDGIAVRTLGGYAGYRRRLVGQRAALLLNAGVSLAHVTLTGKPAAQSTFEGSSIGGAWGGPSAGLVGRWASSSGPVMELGARAGWAPWTVSAQVDGEREMRIGGLFLGLALHVGLGG